MRRLATWLIVGFLGAVVVAATIATLVRDDSNSLVRGGTSPSRPVVPRCRPAQLALSIEMRSDRPAIVLRHVSGPPCDVGTLQITTRVRDQRGETVLVQDFRSAFTGEISPAVDFISGFVYTPLCNQEGPLVATVTAGDITASETLLPVRNCLSPTPTSGESESLPPLRGATTCPRHKAPAPFISCRCPATSRAGKALRRAYADQSPRFRSRQRTSRASLVRRLRQVLGRDRARYDPACRVWLPAVVRTAGAVPRRRRRRSIQGEA
jgi:hypothetical protein